MKITGGDTASTVEGVGDGGYHRGRGQHCGFSSGRTNIGKTSEASGSRSLSGIAVCTYEVRLILVR